MASLYDYDEDNLLNPDGAALMLLLCALTHA